MEGSICEISIIYRYYLVYCFLSIYIVLFTGAGNLLVTPLINDKISKTLNLPTTIQFLLKSEKCILDTKTELIDSVRELKHKGHIFDVKIKGDINSPKVSIDILNMILKERAKKKLEKRVKGKLDDKMKGLFNKFLNNL